MTRDDPDLLTELLATAHAVADAARPATLAHFRRRDLVADSKEPGAFDPVTEADRAAERAMRAVLSERRPDDAVAGEEFGAKEGTTGLAWSLDPIDGTRGFLVGAPTWGVLVAVLDETGPVLGIIDQPFIGERFVGAPGVAEATGPLGRTPLATRAPRALAAATLCTTYPELGSAAEARAFQTVAAAARLTRYGLDCYAYALLAAGHVDLVIEAGLQAHDVAAPIAVVEAAGGLATDWTGGPAHHGGRMLAAANAEIHHRARTCLEAGLRRPA